MARAKHVNGPFISRAGRDVISHRPLYASFVVLGCESVLFFFPANSSGDRDDDRDHNGEHEEEQAASCS